MKLSTCSLLFLVFVLLFSCSEETDTSDQGPTSRDREKFLGAWESATGIAPKERVEFFTINNTLIEVDTLAVQCIYSYDGNTDTLETYLSDIAKLESPFAVWNGNSGDIEFKFFESDNKEFLAFGIKIEDNAELNCLFERVE